MHATIEKVEGRDQTGTSPEPPNAAFLRLARGAQMPSTRLSTANQLRPEGPNLIEITSRSSPYAQKYRPTDVENLNLIGSLWL